MIDNGPSNTNSTGQNHVSSEGGSGSGRNGGGGIPTRQATAEEIDMSYADTKVAPLTPSTRVLLDIEAERLRQVRQEGWTTEHDDEHELGEMAMAAASYAQKSTEDYAKYPNMIPPDNWPWSDEWWKPKNPRRDLVRAAALLAAEIERLDRAERT